MPIYAYIKIPGVLTTESTDLYYGSQWIPIGSYGFATGGDNMAISLKSKKKDDEQKVSKNDVENWRSGELKKVMELIKSLEPKHQRSNGGKENEDNVDNVDNVDDEDNILFDTSTSDGGHLKAMKGRRDLLQQAGAVDKALVSGTHMEIKKQLDAVSPKLHQFCLEYTHGPKKGVAFKNKVELHVCRMVEKNNGQQPELFMAYLLENCGISDVAIDASDSSNLTETVEIAFQQITTATNFDGSGWLCKSWDMVRGEEKPSSWKPALPPPRSPKSSSAPPF
ncbi:MAG: type VI secretion system tube protein Hcp [Opitutaceae bacterium]|jgi:type VI protein secretion system component Hcp|nr:type VI secretion system tube protein Hcp [Opitutaceae bacterium]